MNANKKKNPTSIGGRIPKINPDVQYVFKNVAMRRNADGDLIWQYLCYSRRLQIVQTIETTASKMIAAFNAADGLESVSASWLHERGAFTNV